LPTRDRKVVARVEAVGDPLREVVELGVREVWRAVCRHVGPLITD
jgi:hypothetical protein